MEDQERLEEPEAEKIRRRMWTKLSRKERIGIRRLHVMTSHATRPQMQRMLRYSNAPANVVSAVKYFKCSACERLSEGHHPAVVKAPNPYTFAEDVGLDVFEVKDAEGNRYQVPTWCMSWHDIPSGRSAWHFSWSSEQPPMLGPFHSILDELGRNTEIHHCGPRHSQPRSFLLRASEARS